MPSEPEDDRRRMWSVPELMRQWAGLAALPYLDPTWGSQTTLDSLVAALRSSLVGRHVETRVRDQPLAFTLSELSAHLDTLGTTVGQADDVSLSATQVEYAGLTFAEVTAVLHNVHTRVRRDPTLVAAPVDLVLRTTAEQVTDLLATRVPRLLTTCPEEGRVRLRLRRQPSLGWLDVRPELVGGQVVLRAGAVGWGRWSRRLRRRWPSPRLPLDIPANARVVSLLVEPAAVTLGVRVDEWRLDQDRLLALIRKPGDTASGPG